VLFRKEGVPEAEVAILERYQQHALGSDAFSKRLEKARTLLARSRANP
jgi:hypothetical protein